MDTQMCIQRIAGDRMSLKRRLKIWPRLYVQRSALPKLHRDPRVTGFADLTHARHGSQFPPRIGSTIGNDL